MIMKQEKRDGRYITKWVYSEEPSTDVVKTKLRHKIQSNIAGGKYDMYELVADMANALNDVLNGATESDAITKYKSRQADIASILSISK